MTKDEILKLAKQFIGDTQNRLFTDDELSAMLDRVVTQYSFLSQIKTNQADFFRSPNGDFCYPDDFQKYKVGFNDELPVRISKSENFIEEFATGIPEYIYDDNTKTNVYSLYPSPPDEADTTYLLDDNYGIIKDGGQYGLLPYGGYGCIRDMQSYMFCGEYYYTRLCVVDEIKDIMALIYGMVSECLLADTEMRNHEVALAYKKIFESRCYAAKNRVLLKNKGKNLSGVYY